MMFSDKPVFRRPLAVLLATSLGAATVLHGQEASAPTAALGDLAALSELNARNRPTQTVTVDLIKRLVSRGVLPKEEGEELLLQAEADAAEARAQAALTQAAIAQAVAAQARSRAQAYRGGKRGAVSEVPLRPNLPPAPGPAPSADGEESVAPVARSAPLPSGSRRVVPSGLEEETPPTPAAPSRSATLLAAETDLAAADSEPAASAPAVFSPAVRRRSPSNPPPAEEPVDDDEVRVAYVPETVKAELRAQIKQDVMEQARRENWAAPRMMPDWVMRFRFFGDFRTRYEGQFYPTGNDNTGAFPNFNAINTGAPYDIKGAVLTPLYNVDQDRSRLRIRARLGAEMDLGNSFSSGLRLATGENNSPVTQNQSLGLPSAGQGGNFSKYALWLDRAFLKYELWGLPDKDLALSLGRFDNPFLSSSMVWADDLGFDGLVTQGRFPLGGDFTTFFSAGAFPVFNTDLNFATNQGAKFKSEDKWLYGVQSGVSFEISKDLSAKLGAAYYLFNNITGRRSTPFTPVTSADAGDTDATRPAFAQKGNTYLALRDIVPNELNNFGTINQFQYYGLAAEFRELDLTARLDLTAFESFQVSLFGEYVKNLGFDEKAIETNAVNNRGPDTSAGALGPFVGRGTAWNVNLKLGDATLDQRWNWNVTLGYRNVGSDAVVDGFADSDFGGGGTNVKGFTLASSLALTRHVWLGLRWMSATEVAGPKFKNDILQMDINGKF